MNLAYQIFHRLLRCSISLVSQVCKSSLCETKKVYDESFPMNERGRNEDEQHLSIRILCFFSRSYYNGFTFKKKPFRGIPRIDTLCNTR